uniref:Uncharacterized protein n=1 Tax=Dictyoglomus turgidum TaxID=513050 RepID=A0A7C3SNE9_9BACT
MTEEDLGCPKDQIMGLAIWELLNYSKGRNATKVSLTIEEKGLTYEDNGAEIMDLKEAFFPDLCKSQPALSRWKLRPLLLISKTFLISCFVTTSDFDSHKFMNDNYRDKVLNPQIPGSSRHGLFVSIRFLEDTKKGFVILHSYPFDLTINDQQIPKGSLVKYPFCDDIEIEELNSYFMIDYKGNPIYMEKVNSPGRLGFGVLMKGGFVTSLEGEYEDSSTPEWFMEIRTPDIIDLATPATIVPNEKYNAIIRFAQKAWLDYAVGEINRVHFPTQEDKLYLFRLCTQIKNWAEDAETTYPETNKYAQECLDKCLNWYYEQDLGEIVLEGTDPIIESVSVAEKVYNDRIEFKIKDKKKARCFSYPDPDLEGIRVLFSRGLPVSRPPSGKAPKWIKVEDRETGVEIVVKKKSRSIPILALSKFIINGNEKGASGLLVTDEDDPIVYFSDKKMIVDNFEYICAALFKDDGYQSLSAFEEEMYDLIYGELDWFEGVFDLEDIIPRFFKYVKPPYDSIVIDPDGIKINKGGKVTIVPIKDNRNLLGGK